MWLRKAALSLKTGLLWTSNLQCETKSPPTLMFSQETWNVKQQEVMWHHHIINHWLPLTHSWIKTRSVKMNKTILIHQICQGFIWKPIRHSLHQIHQTWQLNAETEKTLQTEKIQLPALQRWLWECFPLLLIFILSVRLTHKKGTYVELPLVCIAVEKRQVLRLRPLPFLSFLFCSTVAVNTKRIFSTLQTVNEVET